MHDLFAPLGGMFLALALFFLIGLLKPFARRFYPERSSVMRRAAAPVIFACLAMACFRGAGLPALLVVVTGGAGLILFNRRKLREPSAVIEKSRIPEQKAPRNI